MKLLKNTLILLCCILSPTLAREQAEEGWRWKKNFVISYQDKEYPLDTLHQDMAQEITNISQVLKGLPENKEGLIQSLRTLFAYDQTQHEKFKNLSSDNQSIRNLLEKDPRLASYWLQHENITDDIQKGNDAVIGIIIENLKRLQRRNMVLAGISIVVEAKKESVFVPLTQDHKQAVFLSGTGNQLIELLEEEFFPKFTFITFDKPYEGHKKYDGFLKGNLGYILTHTSERIPQALKNRSSVYGREVDTYTYASNRLIKDLQAYNQQLIDFNATVPVALDIDLMTEKALSDAKENSKKRRKITISLEEKLEKVQKGYENNQKLISGFYHSEQLLRIFLYNNLKDTIERFLEKDGLTISSLEQFIVLHIHSLNDVCERCAHCLFLESEMCNVITESKRQKVKRGKGKAATWSADPYGFFEKFNNDFRDKDFKYQILLSSSRSGEKRGVEHRYQTGHSLDPQGPIDLESFPPLLGVQVIPHELKIHPLPSTLRQDQDLPSGTMLHQTYFPHSLT